MSRQDATNSSVPDGDIVTVAGVKAITASWPGLYSDRIRAGSSAAQTEQQKRRKLACSIPIGLVSNVHVVFSLLLAAWIAESPEAALTQFMPGSECL